MTRAKVDWTGRRLDVEVGPVAHGGHCVARFEGRVVFVRHALPGERVTVEVTEDKGGSFCRGDAVEVHTPSLDRVDPSCPLAAPGGCGGCDWQHASIEAQRRLKASVVGEHLLKATGREIPVLVEELPGGPLEWRTRVRMAVGPDGVAGFRAHRSHVIVPVDHCPITVPGLVESVAGDTWSPNAELELVRDGAGRFTSRQVGPTRMQGRRRVTPRRLVAGSGKAAEFAAGRHWDLDAFTFWQVHPAAADTLASVVAEWAEASPGACAWDLYSGVGLFASVLAGQVGESGLVRAVEQSSAAMDSVDILADLPQVEVIARKVETALATPRRPHPRGGRSGPTAKRRGPRSRGRDRGPPPGPGDLRGLRPGRPGPGRVPVRHPLVPAGAGTGVRRVPDDPPRRDGRAAHSRGMSFSR
ncbi:TRAM domain-containing protein [Kibdelosporangium lantanae]